MPRVRLVEAVIAGGVEPLIPAKAEGRGVLRAEDVQGCAGAVVAAAQIEGCGGGDFVGPDKGKTGITAPEFTDLLADVEPGLEGDGHIAHHEIAAKIGVGAALQVGRGALVAGGSGEGVIVEQAGIDRRAIEISHGDGAWA